MKEILDRDRKKQAEREAEKKALAEGAKSNKEEEKSTAGVTSEKPKANAWSQEPSLHGSCWKDCSRGSDLQEKQEQGQRQQFQLWFLL